MKTKLMLLALTFISLCVARAQNVLELSGQWQVSLDSMRTFLPVSLPGTLDIAGIGDAPKYKNVAWGSNEWREVMGHEPPAFP